MAYTVPEQSYFYLDQANIPIKMSEADSTSTLETTIPDINDNDNDIAEEPQAVEDIELEAETEAVPEDNLEDVEDTPSPEVAVTPPTPPIPSPSPPPPPDPAPIQDPPALMITDINPPSAFKYEAPPVRVSSAKAWSAPGDLSEEEEEWTLKKQAVDYCGATSFHGLAYVGEQDRHLCERY